MGLTAEQVDAIVEEHSNTVEALKEQRDNYKEDADKLKDVTKELNDLKQEVADSDADGWKKKYEDEHKAFDDYKKAEASKETLKNVKNAYAKLLKDNGVGEKHIDSILRVTDYKDMKLAEDGTLADAEKLVDSIKEQWSGFITTTRTEGAGTETPPAGKKGTYSSKAEIMKIRDATERQAAIKNNPELFS